ncbi:hypothetical protein DFO77_11755 [Marinilabilia salmonicolor]|uniref:Dolichyl-phosphate-mannose-protein mannosyltransferase n=2 Tax=Marinilabilia salmonicolor TaxID=989 RepID=A0A2T0XRV5_9BACT|nr:hypothetical protein BY457_10274 [Marinilabilia salmonicolor]RCW31610.1 hypothetical protein DFO77_11755 [Marinilabilia salmonicolor]
MLYRTLHNNSLMAFILVPFILLLFWVRVFLFEGVQPISFDGIHMPLWEWLIRPVFGQSVFWAAVFSYVLAVLTAFTVNRVVGRYGLLGRQSVLPALIFGLLVSGFLSVQRLHMVWMFALFFLLGIERIMGAPASSRKEVRCFDGGVLLGIGVLFYAKGLYLYPMIVVAMGVLRVLSVRSFIASLLGLILPLILSAGYFFVFSSVEEFGVYFVLNLFSNTGQFGHNLVSQIYLPVVILLTLVGLITLVRYIPTQKIITRKHFRVVVWLILVTAALCLTPYFSVELTPVLAIGPAIVLAFWFDKMGAKFWREFFLWFLVVGTAAVQFFM